LAAGSVLTVALDHLELQCNGAPRLRRCQIRRADRMAASLRSTRSAAKALLPNRAWQLRHPQPIVSAAAPAIPAAGLQGLPRAAMALHRPLAVARWSARACAFSAKPRVRGLCRRYPSRRAYRERRVYQPRYRSRCRRDCGHWRRCFNLAFSALWVPSSSASIRRE
jgi:hypothetical protein